jgi:lipopolysaccharide/colanic/teichoic acid biosynthesis glycosyltransferase
MAALALAVKLDSPGPVFFGSPRLGNTKSTFTAWKFRSMHQDADQQLRALLTSDPAARREYQRFHKLKDDPRLTRVGSFIRPRPNLVSEGELFGPALPVVLQVRPGLTGLWQVSGRNRLSVQERVALDLEYAKNRTLGGDLVICGRTFLQLWQPSKHGAY